MSLDIFHLNRILNADDKDKCKTFFFTCEKLEQMFIPLYLSEEQ